MGREDKAKTGFTTPFGLFCVSLECQKAFVTLDQLSIA
jgi:hypothetical protein